MEVLLDYVLAHWKTEASLLLSFAGGGLASAALGALWDYRRTRRGLLIAAYSEWMGALEAAIAQATVYFQQGSILAGPIDHAQSELDRISAHYPAGKIPVGDTLVLERADRIKADYFRDTEKLSQLNAAAIENETALSIAMHKVTLVEGIADFRHTVMELSMRCIRVLPENCQPSDLKGLGAAYWKEVGPIRRSELQDLISKVIARYHFRGVCPQKADAARAAAFLAKYDKQGPLAP